MDRRLARRCIASIFLVNIGFAILLSGCYSHSALHQGQVVDGHSMALAFRPSHREFVYGWWESYQASDTRATLAFRRGRAPSKKGEMGYSMGILADLGISPEVSRADPDEIYDDFPVSLRGSYYRQLPKNSLLDAGIGGEFGIWPLGAPLLTPYAIISRDLGTRFTLYSEVRLWLAFFGSDSIAESVLVTRGKSLIVPTFGAEFDISRHLSSFAEVSLSPQLLRCGYHGVGNYREMQCEYRGPLDANPAIGMGIALRGWSGQHKKELVFDDDGNLITEEEIRANMRSKSYNGAGCLFGCWGGCVASAIGVAIEEAFMKFGKDPPSDELSLRFLIPMGTFAGWAVGVLFEDYRDRVRAIELIRVRRRQGGKEQSEY